MHFESFADFIAMGGHGFYVWLCYGIVFFSLVFKYIYSIGGVKRSIAELDRYYRQAARRKESPYDVAFSDPDLTDSDENSSDKPSSEVN